MTKVKRARALGLLLLAAAGPGHAASRFVEASTGLPATNVGYNCSPGNPGGWTGVAFADVDRDGDDDLGAVGRLLSGLHVWLSDGLGTWTESSAGLDADCHGRSDVDWADLDRDLDPDFGGIGGINGAPSVFRNDGGSWAPVSTGLSGGNGEGFTFGDFDGDGHADLATVGHFSGGTRAWLGDGAGNWTEVSAGLTPDLGGHRATAGDFDGDGADELIGTQFGTFDPLQDGVFVWKLDPAARTWSRLASWYFDQPCGVAAADANRDGWNDVIVAAAQDVTGSFGGVHVFLNQGEGAAFVEASNGLPFQDTFYGDLAVGDFENDGDLDIVTGDRSGRMRVFLGDGTGTWTDQPTHGMPLLNDDIEGVGIGDLDGDCRLDVGVAAYKRGVRAYRQDEAVPCPILAEAGPARAICAGAETVLDGSASRACGCGPGGVAYRWWQGATLLRDWAADPRLRVQPAATTLYRLEVACAADPACLVSDGVTLAVRAATAPPALGNVLAAAKSLPAGVDFAWVDLAIATGEYQILALPATLGPPTQAAFDGPLATVVATAPPGSGRATRADALTTPPGLVFYRVRATGTCGGIAGPA